MKINILFSIVALTLPLNTLAEDAPVASPTQVQDNSNPFNELFKTPLTVTDFFVCESDISVSISRKVDTTEAKEDIFYFKANKRGKNGNLILKELQRSLEENKLRAIAECKSENSEKECLTHGLINNQSKYAEFDYATKKAFLDTLVKSCSESKAICNSAVASPPDCFLINLEPPQSVTKEEPSAPEAKTPAKK